MALSVAQKAVLQQAIDYMQGNYEKPLDQAVVQLLTPLSTASFGYTDEIQFQTDLLNKPFSTLLAAMKMVS
jgi:hypothetical protein